MVALLQKLNIFIIPQNQLIFEYLHAVGELANYIGGVFDLAQAHVQSLPFVLHLLTVMISFRLDVGNLSFKFLLYGLVVAGQFIVQTVDLLIYDRLVSFALTSLPLVQLSRRHVFVSEIL